MISKAFNKRTFSLILVLTFFLGLFMPTNIFAHDVYVLQVLVDTDTWLFRGNVVFEKDPMGEGKHYEQTYKLSGNDGEDMYFSFPGPEKKEGPFGFGEKNHATGKDADRAFYIKDVLIPSINAAIEQYAPNRGGEDYNLGKFKKDVSSALKEAGLDKNKKGFIFEIGKFEDNTEPMITAERLIEQAYTMAETHGKSAADTGELLDAGFLEEALASVLTNLYNGAKNLLDLFSIEELIFNRGLRENENLFHYGTFSKLTVKYIDFFYSLTLAMALSFISVAIVALVLKRNAAMITSTPFDLVFIMDGIKKLFLVGFLCLGARPFINILLDLNFHMVNVFSSSVGTDKLISTSQIYGDLLAGSLILLGELMMMIYLNVVYILRGITLALLIAFAPICIMSLSFGRWGNSVFIAWVKEVVSNIFIQAFHALSFAFITLIISESRGIESLVAMFALLPLTTFFKSLIMGNSGGIIDQIAGQATSQGTALAGAAAGATMKGISTAAGGAGKVADWAADKQDKKADEAEGISEINSSKIQQNKAKLSNSDNPAIANKYRDNANRLRKAGGLSKGIGYLAKGGEGISARASSLSGLGGAVALGGTAGGGSYSGMAQDSMSDISRTTENAFKTIGRDVSDYEYRQEQRAERAKEVEMRQEEAQQKLEREKVGIADQKIVEGGRRHEWKDLEVSTGGAVSSIQKGTYSTSTTGAWGAPAPAPIQTTDFTLNPSNFNEKQTKNFEKMQNASKEDLAKVGVRNLEKMDDGKYKMQVDQHGLLNMGVEDIKPDGPTGDLIIETKSPKQQMRNTQIIFDIEKAIPKKGQQTYRPQRTTPIDYQS